MGSVIGLIPAIAENTQKLGLLAKLLNGKPLMAYTIEAAHESQAFDQIVVCSDNEEIQSIGRQLEVVIQRETSISSDVYAAREKLVANFIKSQSTPDDTLIVLLNPASPLCNGLHIVEAIRWYNENTCDGLISVRTLSSKVLLAYVEDQQFLKPISAVRESYIHQSQLPTVYGNNNALFIFSVATFKALNGLPSQRLVPFIMTNKESICVESEEEMRTCSHYLMDLPERRRL